MTFSRSPRFLVRKVDKLWWAIDYRAQRVWRRYRWRDAIECVREQVDAERDPLKLSICPPAILRNMSDDWM